MKQQILSVTLCLLIVFFAECVYASGKLVTSSVFEDEPEKIVSMRQSERKEDETTPIEQRTQAADPNAPAGKIIKYRVRKDASGELMTDASGNFIFVPVYEDQIQAIPPAEQPAPGQYESIALRAGFQRQAWGYGKSAALRDKLQKHAWDIGPEVYHFKYEEPGLMEDTGIFYGAVLNYTYRGWVSDSAGNTASDEKGMIRAEGRFACAQVDYDGSLTDGTPYKINDIDDYVVEARLLFGADTLDKDWLATLYTGVGYRYLNDDTSFDPFGYERESNYLYLPLGYQVGCSLRDGWSWGGTAELDILLLGNQRSHLSDVGSFDVDNSQKKGLGYRASIRLQQKDKNGIFIIEPFIRYWDIGKSEVSSLGWEPANETTEYGIQLIWMF